MINKTLFFFILFFSTKSYSNIIALWRFSFGSLTPEKTYTYMLQKKTEDKFLLINLY